jgi:uncharacterized protein (TIGR02466 family)
VQRRELLVQSLFATSLAVGRLQPSQVRALNPRLLRECLQLRLDDAAGRQWSRERYPGGYTSYGSLCRLHTLSPTFARLASALQTQVDAFARQLDLDLGRRRLVMTDCWVNIMPRSVSHGLHLHPHSVISGTYYVRTPPGASALKLEDPRLDRLMAAPPRRAGARRHNRTWVNIRAAAGQFVLFESWLRHEVAANRSRQPRVSISFNFDLPR